MLLITDIANSQLPTGANESFERQGGSAGPIYRRYEPCIMMLMVPFGAEKGMR
jgi:hypothetical protein